MLYVFFYSTHPSDEKTHAEIAPHVLTTSDEGFTMNTNIPTSTTYRILTAKEVMDMLNIGHSTIYDWMNTKSPRYDAAFPKSIKLGKSKVGWMESQLVEWLQDKMSSQ